MSSDKVIKIHGSGDTPPLDWSESSSSDNVIKILGNNDTLPP